MLNISQVKGEANSLCGRMLAYAKILPAPSTQTNPDSSFPWEELVHHGMLIVLGEFKNQMNLGDFLRKEFKGEVGDGFEGLVQKLRELGEDIPEELNPDELRKRLEGMSNMEIIPVPAKVVSFDSEEDLLKESADIFCVGEFQGVQHAHLAVTSFPILYQAAYREQQSRIVQTEINTILDQVVSASPNFDQTPTRGDPVVLQIAGTLDTFTGSLLELLMMTAVPNLVYNLGNPSEFRLSIQNFRRFMKPYRFPSDLDSIEDALQKLRNGDQGQSHRLELLCRKISALQTEQFEKLPAIQASLAEYQ